MLTLSKENSCAIRGQGSQLCTEGENIISIRSYEKHHLAFAVIHHLR